MMFGALIDKLRYYHRCMVASRFFRHKIIEYKNVCLEKGCYFVVCYHRNYLIKYGTPLEDLKIMDADGSITPFWCRIVPKAAAESVLFHAQAIMSTNNGLRFFNFSEGKTYRGFSSKQEAEEYSKSKVFFPYFNSTTITANDDYCIEKIVKHQPRQKWNTEELNRHFVQVYECYINYLASTTISHIKVKDLFPQNNTQLNCYWELFQSLLQKIESSFDEIPQAFCHCDLHFGNTLIEGDDVFLIDFENVRNDVFFYDLFNIIYVEYTDFKNPYFIDLYLSEDKEIMNLFKKAFDSVGVHFETGLKFEYIYLFLLSRLTHNVAYIEKNTKLNKKESKIIEVMDYISNMFNFINNRKRHVV